MDIERNRQVLNKDFAVTNTNVDNFLKINLNNSQRLLPLNEINRVINVPQRFIEERNRCTYYRIIGTLNTTMSNALFNLNDSTFNNQYTWSWFNDMLFLDISYPRDNSNIDDTDIIYPTAIKNALKEKDGWFGAYEPDKTKNKVCDFLDVEPKRQRFSFIADKNPYGIQIGQIAQPVKNWELTITYPHSTDKTHPMVNGGLLITTAQQAIVSTRNMTAIGLSCKHNLIIGDNVRITGTGLSTTGGYDGDYIVARTGLDNGDLKEYFFVIDTPFTSSSILNLNSRMKKLINSVESEYYFRKFKKIKTRFSPIIEVDDYETYKLAFSENFFNDSIIQFVINEDIDVKDLKDNLNRPLSEIYLTMLKTDSNSLFTSLNTGIETPFDTRLKNSDTIPYLKNIPSINRIHNGISSPFASHSFLENGITINNTDTFYGDLVDYNENTLKETVLAEVMHSFNTINREANPSPTLTYTTKVGVQTPPTKTITLGPRYEGYYYKPHHVFKIREFSTFIETGDEFTEGIPSYALSHPDGTFTWRDLLDLGISQTETNPLDYPFLNNAHYLYQNYCFNLKRQDPFGVWGLYYSKFPEDPIGDRITDKYTVNSQDDDCQFT